MFYRECWALAGAMPRDTHFDLIYGKTLLTGGVPDKIGPYLLPESIQVAE